MHSKGPLPHQRHSFNIDPQLLPLKLSALRPHCPANDQIRLWKPKDARHTLDNNGHPTNLAKDDLERIREVLQETYVPNTGSTYGTGLLMFHIFCDHKGIEEEHRAPVNPTILSSFISTLAGTYGGNTIRNYVYGIRAWQSSANSSKPGLARWKLPDRTGADHARYCPHQSMCTRYSPMIQ